MLESVFKKVFSGRSYIALSAAVTALVLVFAVWLPNWRLVFTVISSPSVSFSEAIEVVFGLFLSLGTNFTVLSASYTIVIAVLFGLNISLLSYYVKERSGSFKNKEGALGAGGLISGIFGIGCAACGTFILSAILGLFGAVALLSYLPLGGEEFGILGVALLVYSVYITARKIQEPPVCD